MKKAAVKNKHKQFKIINIILIAITVIILICIFRLFYPMFIEQYCHNRAKQIVGNQWDKMYKAEGYEKEYVTSITWGFREQLKCERKFGL